MKKLSILLPHLKAYDKYLERLRDVLNPQLTDECEVITLVDHGQMTIGKKRNWCLNKSTGQYVLFIDTDDLIVNDYIEKLFEGINKGVDCCSLRGVITQDGKNPEVFEHSIRYKAYKTNEGVKMPYVKYERFPNHLNCIKASIAKQFKFPEINHGEDTDWATQIFKSGLIKTEHYIDGVIYFYLFRNK